MPLEGVNGMKLSQGQCVPRGSPLPLSWHLSREVKAGSCAL